MTSVPSVVRPCGSGAPMPRVSCSMAGPVKVPLKRATSSHLRTSASPRNISQTILTAGREGEGWGVGANMQISRGAAREMGSGLVSYPLIPSSPGYKSCNCLSLGLGCKALLPVRTLIPSVQGPTKDSGQRRQSPLAVPQPRGEQQVLRASWNAVN